MCGYLLDKEETAIEVLLQRPEMVTSVEGA
jgi:hypothetical protein